MKLLEKDSIDSNKIFIKLWLMLEWQRTIRKYSVWSMIQQFQINSFLSFLQWKEKIKLYNYWHHWDVYWE
jgi:hypothetical protein